MSVKRIAIVLIAVTIVGTFVYIGVKDAANTRKRIEFKNVELKDTSENLKQLDTQYNQLDQQLNEAQKQKQASEAEKKRLQDELEQKQKEKQELEAQLQARAEQKAKLAAAQRAVVNTVTATRTASAQAAPSSKTYTQAEIKAVIVDAADKYGVSRERALRIGLCESSYVPSKVNYNYWENNADGSRSHPSGLFQHLTKYWAARAAKYGYAGASVFDPVANANVTMQMWRDGAANLWECK